MIKFELNKTEYIKRGYDFKHWCHAQQNYWPSI